MILEDRVTGGWTIDHIIPKAHGGTNEDANLAACCFFCNQLKADLSVEEFRRKVRLMISSHRIFIRRFEEFAGDGIMVT